MNPSDSEKDATSSPSAEALPDFQAINLEDERAAVAVDRREDAPQEKTETDIAEIAKLNVSDDEQDVEVIRLSGERRKSSEGHLSISTSTLSPAAKTHRSRKALNNANANVNSGNSSGSGTDSTFFVPPQRLARGDSFPHSLLTANNAVLGGSASASSAAAAASSSLSSSLPSLRAAGSGVVKLNVGGKRYVTARSTIMSRGDNLLTRLIAADERGDDLLAPGRDSEGYIFIDRDGKAFAVILNFLRTGKLLPPPNMSVELLRMELDYFQLLTDETVVVLYASSTASTPVEGRSRSNTTDSLVASQADHHQRGGPRAMEFLRFTETMRRTASEWVAKNADIMTHMLMDKARSDTGGVMNHPAVIQFSSKNDGPLTATCGCPASSGKRIQCFMPDINGLFLRQLEQALRAFVDPYYLCFIEGRRASGNSHVQCRFVAQPTLVASPNDRVEALLLSLYSRIEGWNRHDVKYGGSSLSTVSGGT